MRKAVSAILILAGLLLALYPWISNRHNEQLAASTIEAYQETVTQSEDEKNRSLLEAAEAYNDALAHSQVTLTDPFLAEQTESAGDVLQYSGQLSVDDTGIMAFVEIPKIHCYLPVYHGTSAEVLEKGIGHIEGSSLPIGGTGTHAILSGHTGLNSARLFTDLTELEEGDLFFLHVLGRELAYRVVRIQVIEPEDTSGLRIEEDQDLVSLLTCTPYGVNTHRLVVTGQRTEYTEEILEEASLETMSESSQWMRAYRRAICAGFGFILVMTAVLAGGKRLRRRYHRQIQGGPV